MKIIVVENYEEMSQVAANHLAREILKNPQTVLGMATGSTPIGTYEKLTQMNKNGLLDFSPVRTFNLDEYLGLEPSNDQSYSYFMWQHLFSKINIHKENVHLLQGKPENIEEEIENYEQAIKDCGGIDLQILGIGNNAHIGFNEPGTSFDSITSVVGLTQNTIDANARFFERWEDVPKEAISMGIKSIMQAKSIILLASGKSKSKAIKDTVEGPITTEVPASVLQLHPNVTLIIDKEAAKELSC